MGCPLTAQGTVAEPPSTNSGEDWTSKAYGQRSPFLNETMNLITGQCVRRGPARTHRSVRIAAGGLREEAMDNSHGLVLATRP